MSRCQREIVVIYLNMLWFPSWLFPCEPTVRPCMKMCCSDRPTDKITTQTLKSNHNWQFLDRCRHMYRYLNCRRFNNFLTVHLFFELLLPFSPCFEMHVFVKPSQMQIDPISFDTMTTD